MHITWSSRINSPWECWEIPLQLQEDIYVPCLATESCVGHVDAICRFVPLDDVYWVQHVLVHCKWVLLLVNHWLE